MAEKLTFHQVLRKSSAIYSNIGRCSTRAGVVNGLRHQLFARAIFALDKDSGLCGGHAPQHIPQAVHRLTLAHQIFGACKFGR